MGTEYVYEDEEGNEYVYEEDDSGGSTTRWGIVTGKQIGRAHV